MIGLVCIGIHRPINKSYQTKIGLPIYKYRPICTVKYLNKVIWCVFVCPSDPAPPTPPPLKKRALDA